MNPLLVVMGVSGSGKSTVGAHLAAALKLEFLEGDSLHSARNVALMASGTPLNDDDRKEWLDLLSARLERAVRERCGLVVSCSALKRSYRDILRSGAPKLIFVYLAGSPDLLAERLAARPGHYMPASLLASQLATLEPPDPGENALTFEVAQPPAAIVAAVVSGLRGERRSVVGSQVAMD